VGLAPPASPIRWKTFVLTLVLAGSLMGWASSGLIVTAAFGVAWLPTPPAVPAALILGGLTVGIDPGHGGYDPGVLALQETRPVRECDINLAVCLKLREILERAGAKVILTRETDTDLVKPGDAEKYGSVARAELTRRAEIVLAGRPDLFLSIHCNSFPGPTWRGAQTFYLSDGSRLSRVLAESVQAELVRVTGETDRYPNMRQGIFLLTQMGSVPATTVELGFLSNPEDLVLLQNPDYQQVCALAVFFGVCRFAGQYLPGGE